MPVQLSATSQAPQSPHRCTWSRAGGRPSTGARSRGWADVARRRAGLGHVAVADGRAADGLIVEERVGGAVRAATIADLERVAGAADRTAGEGAAGAAAAWRAEEPIGRTGGAGARAALGPVAHAGRRAAPGAGGLEAVGRTGGAGAVTDLGDVADVGGRAAERARGEGVGWAGGEDAVAGLRLVARASGGAADRAAPPERAVAAAAEAGRAVVRAEIALLRALDDAVAADGARRRAVHRLELAAVAGEHVRVRGAVAVEEAEERALRLGGHQVGAGRDEERVVPAEGVGLADVEEGHLTRDREHGLDVLLGEPPELLRRAAPTHETERRVRPDAHDDEAGRDARDPEPDATRRRHEEDAGVRAEPVEVRGEEERGGRDERAVVGGAERLDGRLPAARPGIVRARRGARMLSDTAGGQQQADCPEHRRAPTGRGSRAAHRPDSFCGDTAS